MEMLSGAEMVVRSLIDQGVKHVFGYPGGAVLDIYDALHTVGGIDHILVRHEQGAVHMADGYARATGEVGVVLVTSGPGATNAVTGIADALMDSIPMIVLSGQVPTFMIGNDAFQEADIVGMTMPVMEPVIQPSTPRTKNTISSFSSRFTGPSSRKPFSAISLTLSITFSSGA